jgi:hypothetical protein
MMNYWKSYVNIKERKVDCHEYAMMWSPKLINQMKWSSMEKTWAQAFHVCGWNQLWWINLSPLIVCIMYEFHVCIMSKCNDNELFMNMKWPNYLLNFLHNGWMKWNNKITFNIDGLTTHSTTYILIQQFLSSVPNLLLDSWNIKIICQYE